MSDSILITIGGIDLPTDVITTAAAHGLATGAAVGISTSGGSGGLPAATPALDAQAGVYFARAISADTLSLHPTPAQAAGNTAKIDITSAGSGTLSLTKLDVRERVERQLVLALRTGLGLTADQVQRRDIAGNEARADGSGNLPAVWLLVSTSDEDEEIEGAAIDREEQVLPVIIDAHLLTRPAGISLSQLANAWIARIKNVLMADAHRTEASGIELAEDTLTTGSFGPTAFDQQRDVIAGVEAEIHYRHVLADAYSVG